MAGRFMINSVPVVRMWKKGSSSSIEIIPSLTAKCAHVESENIPLGAEIPFRLLH
jgi:hypothetical protein